MSVHLSDPEKIIPGNDCGIVWTTPYRTNITPWLKSGENNITAEVINKWNNRIVRDVKNPEGIQYTRTNAKIKFNGISPLLESRLMGKAEILLNKTFKFK